MKGSRPLTLLEIQAVEEYIFWKVRNKKQSNLYTGDKYRSSFIYKQSLCFLTTSGRISEILSLNVGDVFKYGRPKKEIYFKKRNTKGKLSGRRIAVKSGARDMILKLIEWKSKKESLWRKPLHFFFLEKTVD